MRKHPSSTHSHLPHGAIIIVSDSVHMAEFCKTFWGLQGYSENFFGNLAFVDFPNKFLMINENLEPMDTKRSYFMRIITRNTEKCKLCK